MHFVIAVQSGLHGDDVRNVLSVETHTVLVHKAQDPIDKGGSAGLGMGSQRYGAVPI